MVLQENILNIGVTINFDKHFLSNGLQQNIIFLANCLNNIPNLKCYFLYSGKVSNFIFIDKNLCISYSEYFNNQEYSFDMVIYAGFNPGQNIHLRDKEKNKNTKFVIIQCGSELTDSIFYSLNNSRKKTQPEQVSPVDQIWTLPHHKHGISFLKTKYKNENVKIAPYLWDDTFILQQFKELKLDISFEDFKSSINTKKVTVFEPNISFIKTSIIPIYIVERFEREFPRKIESCSLICGDELIKSSYFPSLVAYLDIYNKRPGFIKCYKRLPLLHALKTYGGLVITNQILNQLNNLYLEILYLSLPLLHNSTILKEFGYYYKEFDVDIAAKKIDLVLKYHSQNIDKYNELNKSLLIKFLPNSPRNINSYEKLIKSALNT